MVLTWVFTFLLFGLGVSNDAHRHHQRAVVFFDHDGGVDDFVSLFMLLSHVEQVDLLAVYVTPGDTIMRYAIPGTRALMGLFNRTDVVVGAPANVDDSKSDDESSPNAFPEDFRLGICVCVGLYGSA